MTVSYVKGMQLPPYYHGIDSGPGNFEYMSCLRIIQKVANLKPDFIHALIILLSIHRVKPYGVVD